MGIKKINVQLIFFIIILIPCIIIFLNLFPGTLSSDTRKQLAEALLRDEFENANPLINTLFITLFVQAGLRCGNVNTGVALYTIFQMILYAIVTSYCVETFYRRGLNRVLVYLSLVFYAFNPINIMYAAGMWKDTFFSLFFLATLVFSIDSQYQKLTIKRGCILFTLALIASLSRNSGWSSLLIFAIALFVWCKRHKNHEMERIALTVGSASVVSILTAFVIFPMAGISNGEGNLVRSIPLQQIARTVKDNQLSDEEKAEVSQWLVEGKSYGDIAELYDPIISDPMKNIFDGKKINENSSKFYQMWLNLWKKYRKSYALAVKDHTRAYFWPGAQIWRFDNRIMENDFGVARRAIIKPGVDIAATIYESYLSKIPFYKEWNSGAIVLWLTIGGIIYSLVKKRTLAAVMYIPVLMIYIGLIPISPAALFRYMYAAILAKPLIFANIEIGMRNGINTYLPEA